MLIFRKNNIVKNNFIILKYKYLNKINSKKHALAAAGRKDIKDKSEIYQNKSLL